MGYIVRFCQKKKKKAQPGLNASTILAGWVTSQKLLNSASGYFREAGEEMRSRRQVGRKALERVRSFGQVTQLLRL